MVERGLNLIQQELQAQTEQRASLVEKRQSQLQNLTSQQEQVQPGTGQISAEEILRIARQRRIITRLMPTVSSSLDFNRTALRTAQLREFNFYIEQGVYKGILTEERISKVREELDDQREVKGVVEQKELKPAQPKREIRSPVIVPTVAIPTVVAETPPKQIHQLVLSDGAILEVEGDEQALAILMLNETSRDKPITAEELLQLLSWPENHSGLPRLRGFISDLRKIYREMGWTILRQSNQFWVEQIVKAKKSSTLERRDPQIYQKVNEILDTLTSLAGNITEAARYDRISHYFGVKTTTINALLEKRVIRTVSSGDHHPAFQPAEIALLVYISKHAPGGGLNTAEYKSLREIIAAEIAKRRSKKAQYNGVAK